VFRHAVHVADLVELGLDEAFACKRLQHDTHGGIVVGSNQHDMHALGIAALAAPDAAGHDRHGMWFVVVHGAIPSRRDLPAAFSHDGTPRDTLLTASFDHLKGVRRNIMSWISKRTRRAAMLRGRGLTMTGVG